MGFDVNNLKNLGMICLSHDNSCHDSGPDNLT